MGKSTRKVRPSPEMPLGVCTRARALAAADYLELRSRRLEKPPSSPPLPAPVKGKEPGAARSASARRGAGPVAVTEEAEVEASLGENVPEVEELERNARETTPCSLIRNSDTISTPGSTTRTKSTASNHRTRNSASRVFPSALDIEEFFAAAEEVQRRIFLERYNFDPISELPLPGRYQWEELDA